MFNSGSGSGDVMFAIGQALQGQVNEQKRTIFNSDYDFDSLIGPAKQAIAFYEAQIKATRDAMRAWTLVGIKLKVVKDVRKLIAKLIWDSREEALNDVSRRREHEEQEEQEEQEPTICSCVACPKESSQMKNRFFHKKWPLHLLATTAFHSPLFSSGTRFVTLFSGTITFLIFGN